MQRARNIFSIAVILRRGSKVFYGFSITTKKKTDEAQIESWK